MAKDKYVRFDWAAKRMLRNKANFGVLEGLITVLLNEEIHIDEILESEGNQDTYDDKFNRVDVKAKNSKGEIIIVEIQLTRELYYLERIGCTCWGFVAGKYQTYEPWESMWRDLEADTPESRTWDLTKWFHDLYRPSLRPYDPREIALIKRFNTLADETPREPR